ncbi:uncharacterized protein LOC130805753 [Amaranthus tricolor]|uniref:uncharacterized protein LOC130805753 n=1 Tax=Amaranthus tricolor TaxID=29722 RepID=UPI0025843CAF|nr:uncharacterized protein LOC130805753 [Amaranthus tricolor]
MAETSAHTDSTQTPAFVYCIHPSDHANLKLVNNVFDGVGFGDWKLSMMIGLTAKNKMCFVDDRLMAKSVMYYSFTNEIWSDLEHFGTTTSTKIYSLHEELSKLSQEANRGIAEYFTKAKSIWDEIDILSPTPVCECNGCSCGLTKKVLKLQQDKTLMSFLMKADEQYSPIKTTIFLLPVLPSVSTAYRMLQQEERHKELSKMNVVNNDTMAFAANKRAYYD